jgi:hypothetical protein
VKAVHLLTNPNDHREARSIIEIRQIVELSGIEYIQNVNPKYEGEIPSPRECNDRPFTLTPAHYGCYLAHKDAINKYLDREGLLVFECDTVFTVDYDEAVKRIKRAVEVCREQPEIALIKIVYRHNGQAIGRPENDVICVNSFIETHAYYIPWSSKPLFDAVLCKDWDAYDYVITIYLCDQLGAQIGIFADRPIAVQGIGVSLIDNKLKGSEPHFRNVRYHASTQWKA